MDSDRVFTCNVIFDDSTHILQLHAVAASGRFFFVASERLSDCAILEMTMSYPNMAAQLLSPGTTKYLRLEFPGSITSSGATANTERVRRRVLAPEVSECCAEVAPGHDVAGDLRTIELAALNNPIGLVFARGQPDLKEFAAGRA